MIRSQHLPIIKSLPVFFVIYGNIYIYIYSGREFGTASIEIHLKSCKKKWKDIEIQKPKGERRKIPEEPTNFASLVKGGGALTEEEREKLNSEAFQEYNTKALISCPHCNRTFLPDSLKIHLRSCGIDSKRQGGVWTPGGKNKTRKSPNRMRATDGFGTGIKRANTHKEGGNTLFRQGTAGKGLNRLEEPKLEKSASAAKIPRRPKMVVCYIWYIIYIYIYIYSGREFSVHSVEIHVKSCKKKVDYM